MHVANLCWFQVIWSCWRANWKKRTWSCQTTIDHLTPWSSRGLLDFISSLDPLAEYHHERYSITSLDPLVECIHLHHLTSHSISSLDPLVECLHHHPSTTYSMASFIVFSILHSTRHSSSRKKRRLHLITRPLTRPHGSNTVLNPSQYCVVLSIRVSDYFAISSMYFTFSRTSFYQGFIPQTLCSRPFVIRISLYLFSIQYLFLIFVYYCLSCYHLAITLLLSCFHSVQRLCSLQWCLSSE